ALALAFFSRTAPAPAGHGLATSFAAIEWLPQPGTTPDGALYFLDTWGEERELAAAGSRRAALDVSLRIAREKLAELEAMVQAANAPAARVATERYRALVGRALAAVQDAPAPRAEPREDAKALARSLCQALLEHQYILSVDYETLPRGDRGLLVGVVAQADAAYRAAAPRLSQRDREPFFFKEGEVRWSVRAGMRDD
ncbi:MAG: hypothetical protein HYY35_07460, partial [Deltaproteobacteria bacterium]|nr:hypothetical protein [Deltaproteobacteria bacterium]